jgi:hypothetical protein
MQDWLKGLNQVETKGINYVLITVSDVRGSAPRETGAKIGHNLFAYIITWSFYEFSYPHPFYSFINTC